MKATRLASTTERYAQPALERSAATGEPEIRRVETPEAIAGDRQRSVRQELTEADPQGRGPADGHADHQREAHQLAEQLLQLPEDEKARLTRPLPPSGFCVVDEKV